MVDKATLTTFLDGLLAGSSLFVVSVELLSGGIIDVSVDSESDVSVDDCARLNAALRDHFGAELDDYEVTVGSYGLTSPLLLPRQYAKNVGQPVEVLTADGRKLHGTLHASTDDGFTLSVQRKVRLEGKKRPEMVTELLELPYPAVKYTRCEVMP